MKHYEIEVENIIINCDVTQIGPDYLVSVYDNKHGHIGCTVLSEPRKSHTGNGLSATTSVINRIGHKDELVARMFSEALAIHKNAAVVCTCGIHIDDITKEQLQNVISACTQLNEQFVQ